MSSSNMNPFGEETVQRFRSFPLRGVHAYTNVGYIPSRFVYGVGCRLCNKPLFRSEFNADDPEHVAVVEAHVHSSDHEYWYARLSEAHHAYVAEHRSKRVEESESLRQRAEQLGLRRWKWHIHSLVMEYIVAPVREEPRGGYSTLPSPDPVEERDIRDIIFYLEIYEQVERVALLELAIIKSKRGARNRDDVTSHETYVVHSGATVIISLVLPFLGYPQPSLLRWLRLK